MLDMAWVLAVLSARIAANEARILADSKGVFGGFLGIQGSTAAPSRGPARVGCGGRGGVQPRPALAAPAVRSWVVSRCSGAGGCGLRCREGGRNGVHQGLRSVGREISWVCVSPTPTQRRPVQLPLAWQLRLLTLVSSHLKSVGRMPVELA